MCCGILNYSYDNGLFGCDAMDLPISLFFWYMGIVSFCCLAVLEMEKWLIQVMNWIHYD